MMPRLVAVAALVVALSACSKSEEAPVDRTPAPAMPEVELDRGLEACEAYVARVCACAESDPKNADLADRCYMVRSKPKTVQMLIDASRHEGAKPEDVARLLASARKNIAACMEGLNELARLRCAAPAE